MPAQHVCTIRVHLMFTYVIINTRSNSNSCITSDALGTTIWVLIFMRFKFCGFCGSLIHKFMHICFK